MSYIMTMPDCVVHGMCFSARKSAFLGLGTFLAILLSPKTAFRCVLPYFKTLSATKQYNLVPAKGRLHYAADHVSQT